MKNPLNYIQEYPHRTKQILGITKRQFQELLAQAEIQHKKLQAEIESRKIRINQKGGGRKPKPDSYVGSVLVLTLWKARHRLLCKFSDVSNLVYARLP